MKPPEGFVELRQGTAVAWIAERFAAAGISPFLGPTSAMPDAKGRGGVGSVHVQGTEVVVRPCRRGGALGSLLKDRYTSPNRVRAELAVLCALRREGVPVVTPVAAITIRHGAFWRLRLCTEREEGAAPLPAFVAAHPTSRRQLVEAVGTLLKLAFAAGLRHPDLHLDNVLCAGRGDRVRVVLVDLDRARIRAPLAQDDIDAMLVRMARYAVRHRKDLPTMPSRGDALRLLRALGHDRDARRDVALRLAKKLRRQLAQRGWFRRRGGAVTSSRPARS